MLKVTFLTCAIITTQPLFEGARAGDAVPASPASLSMVWTGRFVNMTKAPVLGATAPPVQMKPARKTDRDSDPDIVGSIPSNPQDGSGRDSVRLREVQLMPLCSLPGLTAEPAGLDLACSGARYNRWSAKAETFNYDLSAVSPGFANAPAPYADLWGDRAGAPQ